MPFDCPLALMNVESDPAPTSESGFVIVPCSEYCPAAMLMQSFALAAVTAAPIVPVQPAVPPGLTHNVAAIAMLPSPAKTHKVPRRNNIDPPRSFLLKKYIVLFFSTSMVTKPEGRPRPSLCIPFRHE